MRRWIMVLMRWAIIGMANAGEIVSAALGAVQLTLYRSFYFADTETNGEATLSISMETRD